MAKKTIEKTQEEAISGTQDIADLADFAKREMTGHVSLPSQHYENRLAKLNKLIEDTDICTRVRKFKGEFYEDLVAKVTATIEMYVCDKNLINAIRTIEAPIIFAVVPHECLAQTGLGQSASKKDKYAVSFHSMDDEGLFYLTKITTKQNQGFRMPINTKDATKIIVSGAMAESGNKTIPEENMLNYVTQRVRDTIEKYVSEHLQAAEYIVRHSTAGRISDTKQ